MTYFLALLISVLAPLLIAQVIHFGANDGHEDQTGHTFPQRDADDGSHKRSGRVYESNGVRECARRVRQIEKGTLKCTA